MRISGEQIRMVMQDGDGEAVKALLDKVGHEEAFNRMKEVGHEEAYNPMQEKPSSLLQHAVLHCNVEVVRAVLSSLGSNEEQVRAITRANYGINAVHIAVGQGKLDILNVLADALGDDYNMVESGPSLHRVSLSSPCFKVFRRVCDLFGDDATLRKLQFEVYHYDEQLKTAVPSDQVLIGLALERFHSNEMTPEENGWLARKVEMLLDHLGDEFERNFICNTLTLHNAVQGGHKEIVTLLLDRLGEFETPYAISKKDRRGRTVFHVSAKAGNVNIFKLLLDKVNADGSKAAALEETCAKGKTVVHFAAGSTDILKLAIEQFSISEAAQAVILQLTHNARREVQQHASSVLHMAVCEKNLTAVQFLLGKFKDSENAKQAISKQDSSGRNLLHLAAEHGAVDIFQMLMLTLGPKQSREMLSQQTTSDGNTVLHLVRDPSLVKLVQLAVSSTVCKYHILSKMNKLEHTSS